MQHRFELATLENGHFAKFADLSNPRITVKPEEIPVSPLYPEDEAYWPLFESVIEEVGQAKNQSDYDYAIAECFQKEGVRRADQAARLVAGDWPSDLVLMIAKAAVNDPDSSFREILPGPFVDKVVLLNRLFGELAHVVAANSGAAKWTAMVPRPQEIAWKIVNELIEAPELIAAKLFELRGVEKMKGKTLAESSALFTRDGIGAPPHCSWIAMHSSAVESAAFCLRVMLSMTNERRLETILAVNNVGGFRETLGVHTRQDNIAGYWLGQETAKRYLPDFFTALDLNVDMDLLNQAMIEAHVDWLETYPG